MSGSCFLSGDKIYLRPVEVSDAAVVQKWHNDPDLRMQARLGQVPVTFLKEENDIRSASGSGDEVFLLIVRKDGDNSIGFIRLNFIDTVSRNVWLRMMVGDREAQGKGIATEAIRCVLEWLFSEMNVHRVTLETYETNEPAIRFFEKVGFVREGLIREAVYDDGRYYNIVSFGLLKSEYRKDHNGT